MNWQNVNEHVQKLTWKVMQHVIEKPLNPEGSKPLLHSGKAKTWSQGSISSTSGFLF